VRERIAGAAARAGRDPSSIRLVAVTKTQPVPRVLEAIGVGLTIFGENRVQEARSKIAAVSRMIPGEAPAPGASRGARTGGAPAPVEWHLIGHLQSNKARPAASLFSMVHSVDGAPLARELDRERARHAGSDG